MEPPLYKSLCKNKSACCNNYLSPTRSLKVIAIMPDLAIPCQITLAMGVGYL